MVIRTGLVRLVGALLLLGAGVDCLALNWNRPSADVCQSSLMRGSASCAPVNYSLAVVLACVGAGLIVVSFFVAGKE